MERNSAEPTVAPEGGEDEKGTLTLSVRFTASQRKLLQKAAEVRGWSATQLLRVAALDRAIHIINVGTPTRIDFRGLAVHAAERLCAPESVSYLSKDGNELLAEVVDDLTVYAVEPELREIHFGNEVLVSIDPKPMNPRELTEFERAARLGGGEFLSLLVDACNSVSARDRTDLPEPIDPRTIAD